MAPSASLPESLEVLANPRLSDSQVDIVLEKLRSGGEGRLSVAVIDNGVDYTHPQILSQIRFEVENNQVVGAGADVLGGDSFASPNLINAEFFAFGARAVSDGAIDGPVENPMALLTAHNAAFMQRLIDQVKQTRSLRNTLYASKLSADSLTVFAVHRWISMKLFNMEKFKEAQSKKLLLPHDMTKLKDEQSERLGKRGRKLLYQLPWMMGPNGEIAFVSSGEAPFLLAGFEKADEFMKVVEKVWSEFSSQSTYLKDYATYVQYGLARESKPENIKVDDYSKSQMSALAQAWFEVHYNHPNADRTDGFVEALCESVTDSEFEELRSTLTTAERKDSIIRSYLEQADRWAQQLNEFVLSSDQFTRDNKDQATQNQRLYSGYRAYGAKYLEKMGTRLLSCDRYYNLHQSAEPASLERERRVSHPYWGRGNDDESHGTHVAGVIAAQSPRIDIYPVRVATSTTEPLQRSDSKLKSELKAQFSFWLKNPVILRGVQSGLKRSLALVDGDEASNTAKVQEAFDAYVDENFGSFRLDVYFIEEVKQALKKVGAQSIKVANISLGTSFEKSIAQLNPDDLEKEKESLLKFFMYELFKSEVARVATDYAPHTLFVIAAGNDGAWVDGRSRSALPCDLSAVYFEKFAQPGDESQIESQRLKNVLCVGSVGPEKEVSSFSNIPLTPIPFVFSYGEQIYSHIKTTDCTGAAQERSVLSGESPSYPSLTEYKEDVGLVPDERGIAFMKSIGVEAPATLKGKSRDRWLRDEYSRVREIYLGLWPELRDLTLYQRCLDDKAPAAKLSGTSMATPAVTGYIARRILEKMDQLGVQETQAYSMDEFSPARLIAELSAQQGTYGGNSILSKVPMIADIQKVLLAPMSDWPRVLGFESKGSWFFSQVRRGSLTTSGSHSSP